MTDHPVPASGEPYAYNIRTAPNRQVVLPKTVPLPSLKTYLAEQQVVAEAEEAKYQKAVADYPAAKVKAEAEGKEPPKPPVKAGPKKESSDLVFPVPSEAKDPDLLLLQALLGEKVEEIFEQAGEITCQVAKEAILDALKHCHQNDDLKYEMLADETGTQYPAASTFAFSVVYHLTSLSRRKRIRLRILIPEGFEPESATQVYPTANWFEREAFDMLGIRFQNHPNLTRILCPDDWEGHPLRKEYPTTGWGQRDINLREDRSGMIDRLALEKAGNNGINLMIPKAE